MKSDKNIDRLFQEKFKDFEVHPNPNNWNVIEERLQKRKRRVIPFWWFGTSGVAVLVIVGLLLFRNNINNGVLKDNTIDQDVIVKDKDDSIIDTFPLINNTIKKEFTLPKNVNKTTVGTYNSKIKKQKDNFKSLNSQEVTNVQKEVSIKNDTILINSYKVVKNKSFNDDGSKLKTSEKLDNKDEKHQFKNEDNKTKEEFLLASSNDTVEKNINSKWSIAPTVAILNTNSFKQASSINTYLNDNDFSGKNTYSYGVKVAYQLTKKWSIQSGLHIQNLQFDTEDVTITSKIIGSENFSNIEFNTDNMLVLDSGGIELQSDALENNILVRKGVLSQKYGYLEVPFEVKYTLFKKNNFKSEIITGFSTLVLNRNQIEITDTKFSKVIGKATNLNLINFSSNLGIDLTYSFSKKWKLTINPMFKTQLNTFSEKSNGFKPYFIGVYTGIFYQF